MTLPEHLVRSVENIDLDQLRDIEQICDDICSNLLRAGRPDSDSSSCHQKLFEPISSVFIEAIKRSLSSKELNDILPDNKLGRAIINKYERYADDLKRLMASIGWEYPEVIDFDWTLSQLIESNECKEDDVIAELHLSTRPTESLSAERISFACDISDLQLLLWEFKKARNSIENLRNV